MRGSACRRGPALSAAPLRRIAAACYAGLLGFQTRGETRERPPWRRRHTRRNAPRQRTVRRRGQADAHPAPQGEARVLVALLVILALGGALRGLYLAEFSKTPDFRVPFADADFHNYWARALAFGNWTPPAYEVDPHIREIPYFRPPGYAYFLAAVYKLTGPGYFGPRVFQMALGLLNAFLAFLLARRFFGNLAGLVLAGLMATFWPFIYTETDFEEPVVSVFLLLAARARPHAVGRSRPPRVDGARSGRTRRARRAYAPECASSRAARRVVGVVDPPEARRAAPLPEDGRGAGRRHGPSRLPRHDPELRRRARLRPRVLERRDQRVRREPRGRRRAGQDHAPRHRHARHVFRSPRHRRER